MGTELGSSDVESDEIARYLLNDGSRTGDAYRGRRDGLDAVGISERLGVDTPNWVYNQDQILAALLDRKMPNSPSIAVIVARKYRSMLKLEWSPETRQRLMEDLDRLERIASDVDAVAEENAAAVEQSARAEANATVGVYVYALPHYLRYPFEPETGRTLLKVGHSDRDVIQRMRDQARTTAIPEDPVLLRIYPTPDGDSAEIEARFHRTLRAFDHSRAVERMAGREWFLTTTRALDAVAELLGLSVVIVNDDGDSTDD